MSTAPGFVRKAGKQVMQEEQSHDPDTADERKYSAITGLLQRPSYLRTPAFYATIVLSFPAAVFLHDQLLFVQMATEVLPIVALCLVSAVCAGTWLSGKHRSVAAVVAVLVTILSFGSVVLLSRVTIPGIFPSDQVVMLNVPQGFAFDPGGDLWEELFAPLVFVICRAVLPMGAGVAIAAAMGAMFDNSRLVYRQDCKDAATARDVATALDDQGFVVSIVTPDRLPTQVIPPATPRWTRTIASAVLLVLAASTVLTAMLFSGSGLAEWGLLSASPVAWALVSVLVLQLLGGRGYRTMLALFAIGVVGLGLQFIALWGSAFEPVIYLPVFFEPLFQVSLWTSLMGLHVLFYARRAARRDTEAALGRHDLHEQHVREQNTRVVVWDARGEHAGVFSKAFFSSPAFRAVYVVFLVVLCEPLFGLDALWMWMPPPMFLPATALCIFGWSWLMWGLSRQRIKGMMAAGVAVFSVVCFVYIVAGGGWILVSPNFDHAWEYLRLSSSGMWFFSVPASMALTCVLSGGLMLWRKASMSQRELG